jgi:peptide/nickel transport system ATP-binding protein
MINNAFLKVENLTIGFWQKEQLNHVVDHISFSLNEGEILGIVGESGSGKTMTALAIMGLLPKSAQIDEGRIRFMDQEIIGASDRTLRELKGSCMAMIFQEPMTSFNPLLTIGLQVEEMLRLHEKCSQKEYKDRTFAALKEAGLEEAEAVYYKYPHQLSGGMRQRAMIAMAMIAGPKLLIADEPTTALDVTIQDKILKLLKLINQTHGTSIILVSHDLAVIKSICSRALVMKDGRIVEAGNSKELFKTPQTEYTKALVAAAPIAWMKQQGIVKDEWGKDASNSVNDKILRVEGLSVFYQERTVGFFKGKHKKQVVKNASFFIRRGEALGIVGESGCGKTTLAKAIAGLIKDTEGTVTISALSGQGSRPISSQLQMVFQDPYGSLNPVKKIGWILEEPLRIQGELSREKRREKVLEVTEQVGLEEIHLGRYLSQLSGGQRQRVAIALALILNPELIILDEPVSSLDVTVQAQILELLKDLQQRYQLTYLFISHDLNVIYQVCDRVCVMYQGEIVETRNTKDLFFDPQHDYSKVLLEASLPE